MDSQGLGLLGKGFLLVLAALRPFTSPKSYLLDARSCLWLPTHSPIASLGSWRVGTTQDSSIHSLTAALDSLVFDSWKMGIPQDSSSHSLTVALDSQVFGSWEAVTPQDSSSYSLTVVLDLLVFDSWKVGMPQDSSRHSQTAAQDPQGFSSYSLVASLRAGAHLGFSSPFASHSHGTRASQDSASRLLAFELGSHGAGSLLCSSSFSVVGELDSWGAGACPGLSGHCLCLSLGLQGVFSPASFGSCSLFASQCLEGSGKLLGLFPFSLGSALDLQCGLAFGFSRCSPCASQDSENVGAPLGQSSWHPRS